MKIFVNWKVLFGLALAATVVLLSVFLFSIRGDRERVRMLVNQLMVSVEIAERSNQKLRDNIDSLSNHLEYMASTIEELEAEKDLLRKGISRPSIGLKAREPGVIYSGQSCYINCGNLVQIDLPQKYMNTKLKYLSDEADIIETPDPGRIVMVPKNRNVRIVVTSGGIVINKIQFLAKNVPEPTYQVYQDGQKVDVNRGVLGRTISTIRVAAVPDPDFRIAVPKDARYQITKWELIVKRGTSAIINRRVNNSESVDLSSERSRIKAGDIVVINLVDAVRSTYRDKNTMIVPNDGFISFPIY